MKVPAASIPILIVCTATAALLSTRLFAIPTLTVEYDSAPARDVRTVEMVVQGVTCTDTAKTASEALTETDGILRFVAYASYNRIEITYVPSVISIEEIIALLEGPIYFEESGEFRFNVYRVLACDGSSMVP